ncbi:MAG: glycosyltransferase [Bifidobacteriaceae bacterium]|jgi:glycosyltransferase involved in cell wall biosynthesis|nr:glycosyltransferase [Bifidobacteriaceae bacterium]
MTAGAAGTGRRPGGAASGDFAVLLPVYWGDTAEQVAAAFRSVTEDQELAPAEIVVVRDGPVGPALAALLDGLAARPDVSLLALPRGLGLAGALNAGLATCRFEVVARQDADDLSVPRRFARTVPLVASGEFDLVGAAMREFAVDSASRVSYGRLRRYPLNEAEIRRTAKAVNPFAHPTVVTRRSLVLSAGGYRDFFHLEDYDLWARLLQGGARAANLAEPLVNYRVSAAGWRRRGGLKTLRAEIRLQRAFLDSGFTSRREWLRNLVARGALELAPPAVLRAATHLRLPRFGSALQTTT